MFDCIAHLSHLSSSSNIPSGSQNGPASFSPHLTCSPLIGLGKAVRFQAWIDRMKIFHWFERNVCYLQLRWAFHYFKSSHIAITHYGFIIKFIVVALDEEFALLTGYFAVALASVFLSTLKRAAPIFPAVRLSTYSWRNYQLSEDHTGDVVIVALLVVCCLRLFTQQSAGIESKEHPPLCWCSGPHRRALMKSDGWHSDCDRRDIASRWQIERSLGRYRTTEEYRW